MMMMPKCTWHLERVVKTHEKLETNALKYLLLEQSVFHLLRLHYLPQQLLLLD